MHTFTHSLTQWTLLEHRLCVRHSLVGVFPPKISQKGGICNNEMLFFPCLAENYISRTLSPHLGRSNWSRMSVSTNLPATPDHILRTHTSVTLKSSEDCPWMSTVTGPQKATVPETLMTVVSLLFSSWHVQPFNSFHRFKGWMFVSPPIHMLKP